MEDPTLREDLDLLFCDSGQIDLHASPSACATKSDRTSRRESRGRILVPEEIPSQRLEGLRSDHFLRLKADAADRNRETPVDRFEFLSFELEPTTEIASSNRLGHHSIHEYSIRRDPIEREVRKGAPGFIHDDARRVDDESRTRSISIE